MAHWLVRAAGLGLAAFAISYGAGAGWRHGHGPVDFVTATTGTNALSFEIIHAQTNAPAQWWTRPAEETKYAMSGRARR